MQRARPLVIAVALFLSTTFVRAVRAEDAPAPAAAPEAGRLELSTERAVVFKDGYALFVERGAATADADGRLHTAAVPAGAILGCVWATSDDGKKILGMRSEWVERSTRSEKETPCLTVLELLRANVGHDVTIRTSRDATLLTGRLLEVLEMPAPTPDAAGGGRNAGPSSRAVVPGGGQLAVLERRDLSASDKPPVRFVLPVADVVNLWGPDLVTKMRRVEEGTVREKRLTLDLGKEAAGKASAVRLLYFAEGMRWIPTYRVGGGLATDADVSLQGEVLNEAHDLKDASLDLVVGVPSFRFKEVASPLSLERALVGALREAAPQLAQQMGSNRISNAFGNDEASIALSADGAGDLRTAPELATEARQDLFVYGVGKVSLGKGTRATFPLWQTTASLRHLYTMDVAVVRNFRSGEHQWRSAKAEVEPSSTRPDRPGTSAVWHELELSNATQVPWTTGAALLVKGDVPLGQDLLRYTSPGAKTLLPMTVAVDLQGTWKEEEVSRQSDALSWSGTTFSIVRKQGTVTLVNRRKEASPVRVSISLGGRAETPTDLGRVTVNDLRAGDWTDGAFSVNNHSDVTWDLTLAPGETKTVSVPFSFYVR